MGWENDDSDEERGSLAVADDFMGDGNGAAPRSMPDPVGGGSQPVDDTPPSSEQQADPTEMEMLGQSQEQSPAPAQQQSGGDVSESEYADSQASSETGSGTASDSDDEQSYLSPSIKAPTPPNFGSYVQSQGPAQLQAAKAAFDPTKYKPSVGRRIAAGIAGFAGGFGSRNPAEGIAAGRAITGAPLAHAQAAEAQKESAIQAQIDADNAQNATIQRNNQAEADKYNLAERDMRNQGYVDNQRAQASQRDAQAMRIRGQVRPETLKPDDPDNPVSGTWSGLDGYGRKVTGLSAPDNYLKTPAGKAAVIEDTIKRASAAGHPFTPEQEAVVRSGGHVTVKNPTNIHNPSAEAEKYNDWKTTFTRENKRPPNAAEISAYGHQATGAMSKSLGDRISSQKNTQISAAQKDFNSGVIDKDKYLGEWQAAQDEYEQRLSDATGQDVPHVVVKDNVDEKGVWHGQSPAKTNASGAAPVASSQQSQRPANAAQQSAGQSFQHKGKTYTAGQQIMVDGKPAKVLGINPKTGKLIVNGAN